MGHATHFLQRLDRVNELQVELALTLYHDRELLKTVLNRAQLPESAERVAVSLGDPVRGPFVVMTRTGQFVTCLAEGMHVDNLPVVTRAQFDVASGRVQRARDEMKRIQHLVDTGGKGEAKRLLRALATSGPRFCREDATQLNEVSPLIAPVIIHHVVELMGPVVLDMPRFAALRPDKLSPTGRDEYLEYGRKVWAVGHALPFLAVSETRALAKQVGVQVRAHGEFTLPSLAFDLLTVAHGHRALWVAARSGKEGLALARQPHPLGERLSRRVFRELTIGAIAFRSPSLRHQAVRKLSPDPVPGMDPEEALAGGIAKALRDFTLPHPEAAVHTHAEHGRRCMREALRTTARSGKPFESLNLHIPDHLAHAFAATLTTNWLGEKAEAAALATLLSAAPWLARVNLPELYLPREWSDRLLPELSVENTARWLESCASLLGIGRPQTVRRVGPKQERNAACNCGSGKKWKRCCARSAARANA